MKAEDLLIREVVILKRAATVVEVIGQLASGFSQDVVGYIFVCGSHGSFELKLALMYTYSDKSKADVRAFVGKLLEHFHLKAVRSATDPCKLIVDLGAGLKLVIDQYPTTVKYSCEKKCVAILPDGRTVPMEEVPIEA